MHTLPTPMSPAPQPAQPPPAAETASQEQLPIDIRTVLIGVRRRIPLALLIAVLGAGIGVLCGYLVGDRVYQAATVLLFREPHGAGAESEANQVPNLRTHVDLVKIRPNLEEVRRRLRLPVDIDTLGGAFSVSTQANTSLMSIAAVWSEPQLTAALANTLRDVFLEAQRDVRRSEAESKARDLQVRLDRVMEQQASSDLALKSFAKKEGIVDLEKEAQWYLEQLITTELVYDQAQGERDAANLQAANVQDLIKGLQSRVAIEERVLESGGRPEEAGIDLDDEMKGRQALVEVKQRQVDRAQALFQRGLVSSAEFDRMRADLEIERYEVFNHSPTAVLLREMTLQEMKVKLESIAAEERVTQLGEAVTRVRNRLHNLPLVQQQYVMLKRSVEASEIERRRLEQLLAVEERTLSSETFGFNLISAAQPPIYPLRSNRRLLAIGVTAVFAFAGIGLVLLLELSDTRLKSVRDAEVKLGVPVLAGLPEGPVARDTASLPHVVAAYQKLRATWSQPGVALMVAGAAPGGDSAQVALRIARIAASYEHSALLIDAETQRLGAADWTGRGAEPRGVLGWARRVGDWLLWPGAGVRTAGAGALVRPDEGRGLRAYLAGEVDDWRDLLEVDEDSGAAILPRGGTLTSTSLASDRMEQLVRAARREYACVIVHATSVTPLADATFLARHVDAAIVEVSARTGSLSASRLALQRLSDTHAPVAGVVLTDVEAAHLRSL